MANQNSSLRDFKVEESTEGIAFERTSIYQKLTTNGNDTDSDGIQIIEESISNENYNQLNISPVTYCENPICKFKCETKFNQDQMENIRGLFKSIASVKNNRHLKRAYYLTHIKKTQRGLVPRYFYKLDGISVCKHFFYKSLELKPHESKIIRDSFPSMETTPTLDG